MSVAVQVTGVSPIGNREFGEISHEIDDTPEISVAVGTVKPTFVSSVIVFSSISSTDEIIGGRILNYYVKFNETRV